MGTVIYVPGTDFSGNNMGQVTLSGSEPITGITINGNSEVTASDKFTYTLTPALTTQRNVVWSIVSGSEYATIDQDGLLRVSPSADEDTVVIRLTSASNSSIYAEKNLTVTGGTLESVDWLATDGDARIFVPMSGKNPIDVRKISFTFILDSTNGYMFSAGYTSQITGKTSLRAYLGSDGNMKYAMGGNYRTGPKRVQGVKYKYVFELAPSTESTSVLKIYNADTDELLHTSSDYNAYLNSDIFLFNAGFNSGGGGAGSNKNWGGSSTAGLGKLYDFSVEYANGVKVYNLVPKIYNGVGVLQDTVSGQILYNDNEVGSFTFGNDE